MEQELAKLFQHSETAEVMRSQIHPAAYNPRVIDPDAKAALKRSIKRFGVVGGIVVNKQTGYTIVSGHQKVEIADEINGYPEKDYCLKVEVIDVDLKTEKELNIFFNNPSGQGRWDEDKLRKLIPEIDTKIAGFSNEDLAAIGIIIDIPQVSSIVTDIQDLQRPAEERKQAVKEAKAAIKQQAEEKALEAESFVTLSFGSYKAKSSFMLRFGFDPMEKFVNGDVFADMVERVE